MKKIRTLIIALGILLTGTFAIAPLAAHAVTLPDPAESACTATNGHYDNGVCTPTGKQKSLPDIIKDVVNVLLYLIGAIAVIMIIVGAFRYVLSAGNQASVTAAKNTIFYAVIGLVIAILAYAIVNFVVTQFKG